MKRGLVLEREGFSQTTSPSKTVTLSFRPILYLPLSQMPSSYQSMGEAYVDDPRLSPMVVQMETHDGHFDARFKRRREARRQRRNEEKPDNYSGN